MGELKHRTTVTTVDYSLSLEEMLAMVGFDYVDEGITAERFSTEGNEKVDILVTSVHYMDWWVPPSEVIEKMKRQDLRPATLAEGLAFMSGHSDQVLWSWSVLMLGSSWVDESGTMRTPRATEAYGKRYLFLSIFSGDDEKDRIPGPQQYLAVPIKSPA